MPIDDSGPAFPTTFADGSMAPGMSKREFYASQAMKALIGSQVSGDPLRWAKPITKAAVLYADELAAALKE